MKTKPQQPTHTKGDKLVAIEATINSTSNGGTRIANVDPMFKMSMKERCEYAKRIVKAVNSFEAMKNALEALVKYEDRGREKGEPRIAPTFYKLAKDALKQAEQK